MKIWYVLIKNIRKKIRGILDFFQSIPIFFSRKPNNSLKEIMAVRNIASIHPMLPRCVAFVRSKIRRAQYDFNFKLKNDSIFYPMLLERNSCTSSLNKHGYYKFMNPLNSDYIKLLKEKINSLPVKSRYSSAVFDSIKNVSNPAGIYQYSEDQLINLPIVQDYVTDPFFHKFAADYFGCPPILDEVESWWSYPDNMSDQKDLNAQMFHSDRRRLFFLKFFLYLEDVDSNNGPHVVIPCSHRLRHKKLRSDSRFSDEIVKTYTTHAPVELSGPAGTLIAVDTQALHKGKVLESGRRLILELHFSTDMLGPPSDVLLQGPWASSTKERIKEFPHVFQRLDIG